MPADDEWIIANSGLTAAVRAMEAAGAKVVVIRPAPFDFEGPGFVPEFNWGLREGVNAYLAATDAPVGLWRTSSPSTMRTRAVTRRGARIACATASGVRLASMRRARSRATTGSRRGTT